MAEVEQLVARLTLDLRQFRSEMLKAQGVSTKTARDTEKAWAATNGRLNSIGRSMASGLVAPLAAIGAAASAREVTAYADAWTVAGNKLAAASQSSGRQARSLEELNALANDTRSGIGETVDLYAKLLRSTKDVAKSEEDVAKATEIVNKAFKAGGAGASEQAAGILQLSQALGSGVLQGDELRSLRENAPLLAQAIADEFGTTIAGLKKLGAEGELTSERVFQAILKAQPKIQAMFGTTNQTIADGVTKVNNAFTQYIGQTDSSLSASERLVAGLNALADNFDGIADATLKVAAIIAGALVGRAIGGMIAKLGLAAGAMLRFVAALKAAQGIAKVSAAIGGIGAAAGPVGLAVGTILTGALIAFGAQSGKASDAADAYAAALKSVEDAAASAADEQGRLNEKFSGSTKRTTQDAVGIGIKDQAEKLAAAVKTFQDAIDNAPRRLVGDETRKQLQGLNDDLGSGRKTADEVSEALNALAESNPKFKKLAEQLDPLLKALDQAIQATGTLKGGLTGLAGANLGDMRGEETAALAQARKEREFLAGRTSEAQRAENDKAIDARAKEIIRAGNEVGLAITEAAAKIQAAGEIAAETATKAAASTAEVIKKYEGFSATPYFDVNAFRAGYGSDTVTLSDGSIRAVVQGMTVTLADAERDLARRIGEFQDTIKRQIGGDTFNAMSQGQQDALTSIAYNYGSLPERIVEAIKTGNEGAIYTAIRGLGGDNGGVNRRRRNDEAELFAGGSGQPSVGLAQETGKASDEFAERLEQQRQYIASLQAEAGIRATLNPLVNDYGKSAETVKIAQELLNEAQKQGIAAGLELKDVQQLLYGDLSGLSEKAREQALAMRELAIQTGTAEAAGQQLATAQDRLSDSMRQSAEFGKDVLGGFIRDLREGKSASEALANALNKVADKLLDVALNSIFGLGGSGGGGGGLGGIFGAIGKLFGFAKGTPNTGGKRGQPMGIVHGQEAVIPLGASGEVPVVVKQPQAVQRSGAGSNETVTIMLQDDTGRMADIANAQIKTHAGTIIKVAAQQSFNQVKGAMPGLISDAQNRRM